MTMLRTSVALRQESIKTSFLGKFKTIIQMGGIGTIFLTVFGHKLAMQIFSFSLFVALLLLGVFLGLKNKKWPAYWIFPVSGTFLYWFLLLSFFSSSNAVWLQMLVIVAITWISAFDYLYEIYRIFLQTGFHMWDFARLLWAFSFCLGVLPFIDSPGIVIFILISISFELALGGVDNVVATEQAYAGNKPFFVSSLMSVLFLGIMLLNQMNTQLVNPMVLAGSLAFSSAVIFFLTYRQWRQLFARVLD